MVNVIPQEMQKIVHRELRARFVFAAAIVLLICAVLSFLMLLPSYFALTATTGAPSATSANLNSQSASDTAVLINAKSLLSVLAPLIGATTTPSQVIESALALRPTHVHIDQITYIAGTPSTLILVGSAVSNSDISSYKIALGSDTLFSSVVVPVGALVGTDGGRFSMTLSGKF
jgi:hypothetical protein